MPMYYIDFSSWEIVAKDDKDAYKKAREILENSATDKHFPVISSIEENEFPGNEENKIELE